MPRRSPRKSLRRPRSGDIDYHATAFAKLNGVKFTPTSDAVSTSVSEVIAKSLFDALRDKLAVRKALHSMRTAMQQNSDLENVLMGVSAALDAGKDDQAAEVARRSHCLARIERPRRRAQSRKGQRPLVC